MKPSSSSEPAGQSDLDEPGAARAGAEKCLDAARSGAVDSDASADASAPAAARARGSASTPAPLAASPRPPASQRPAWILHIDTWRWVSLVAAWMLGALSLALLLGTRGAGVARTAAFAVALALCIFPAAAFRLELLDFFHEFRYREKFALFLAHLILLVSPMGVLGAGWLPYGLSIILAAQGPQLIAPLAFHRFLALCGLFALMGLWRMPAGPGAAAAIAWCLLAGGMLLVKRVRFAIEESRIEELGVSLRDVMLAATGFVILPLLLAGILAWGMVLNRASHAPAASLARHNSPPALTGMTPGAGSPPVASAVDFDAESVIYQGFALAVVICLALIGLQWHAARRSKKSVAAPQVSEDRVAAALETQAPAEPRPRLDPLEGGGPRQAILRTFRRWENSLTRLKLGRRLPWTAREFTHELGKFAKANSANSPEAAAVRRGRALATRLALIAHLFEQARYHPKAPTPEEARQFEELTEEALAELQETAAQRGKAPKSPPSENIKEE